jgi:GT2 family glycosyltransferase
MSPSRVALISVCIVNWNCRELLRGCLNSLLEQAQGSSLEVIVVDNASSDGAADMVARDFPQVQLIQNERNVGFAHANNQAARAARGQFLLFLNNDTVVPAGTLVKLVDYLQAHPEATVVGPALRDGRGKLQISYRQRPTITTFLHRALCLRWTGMFRSNYESYRRETGLAGAQPVDVLMGAALMMRRDDFWRLGAWDEDFAFGGEDLELCYRANQRGQVVYLADVEIIHFGRVSTRRNVGYASPRIAAGFATYFRKSGANRAALLLYKLAITLDAPLQVVVKGCQYLVRRARGRRQQAEKSLATVHGAVAFLGSGLVPFWRA